MSLPVSANPITITVTTTPAPAFVIPGVEMSAVDPQAPKRNIAEASVASTTATIFVKRETPTISGQSGVFIGVVGAAGKASLTL